MGKVTDLAKFRKLRRGVLVPVQAFFGSDEAEGLDGFVEFCRSHGIPEATRESVVRALVLDGIEVFQEGGFDG